MRYLLAVTLVLAAHAPGLAQSWPLISFTDPIGGFDHPTHVAVARDGSGRLFVTEKAGVIRIVNDGVVLPTAFLNITGRPGTQGNQGLLSVAFPPDYASRQRFYVNYVTSSNTVVVARYRLTADPDVADPDSEEIVLTIGPLATSGQHFGGELAFGPDGYLYFGVGAGSGGAPDSLAQDLTVLRGKILRIDVETGDPATYTIPAGNPYLGHPTARPEIWAFGVRNPWRSSFDRQTGDFYIADVGQSTREEVDVQPAGSAGGVNYGWNIMEGSLCFGAETCDSTGLALPVAEYDHTQGCSITGGAVYRAARYPTFAGIYFYGDWCSGRIWGLQQLDGSWQSSFLSESNLSLIAFAEDEHGYLWGADYSGGAIYSIVEGSPTPVDVSVTQADSADPSPVGNQLTYTLHVTNNSAATATGVLVNDTWTGGATFVSATSDRGTCSRSGSSKVACRIPSLAAGVTAVITLVLQPTAAGTIVNSVTADANEPDTDSTDNSATEETTIAPTVQVTVQTSLPGRVFTVDGVSYTTPQTFSWTAGSSHTIGTTSPQNGGTGVRYVWTKWSDNGAISHTVAPTINKTYTATFKTQYYLTMSPGTGGTVSPTSGWRDSGASVSISATATNTTQVSYSFAGWAGSGAGAYSGTNNPASITVNGPLTESATFTQNPVQVTVQTTPAGRPFSVDGTPYTSAQTFSWQPGSSHTIGTTSPQNGGTGVRYVWTRWSDNGVISHTVAPTTNKTYTATFKTQYFLTMSPGTGGTVSPTSGWRDSGATVSISATATNTTQVSYSFAGWAGSGAGAYSGTNNPASITMNGPVTESATFTQNPVQVTVQTNPAGRTFSVDGTSYTSPQTFSWPPGSTHTIATTSPQSGGSGIQYVWNNWTGGGAISHTVAPTTNKTYTATFNTQYYLTMTHGTGGTVTPTSGWRLGGSSVSISATPATGYTFNGWTGTGTGSYSGTNNPASITIVGPMTETAAFTQN